MTSPDDRAGTAGSGGASGRNGDGGGGRDPLRRARRPLWVAAGVVVVIAAVVAYVGTGASGGSSSSDTAPSAALETATVLPTPIASPTQKVPTTSGRQIPLVVTGPDSVSLLYFGYTHCPDICPINMAALSAAIRAMPAADRGRVRMVFDTVDPARDTPSVLKTWLATYSTAFIGVVPKLSETDAVLTGMGLPTPTTAKVAGGYDVSHVGGIYVFTSDGKAHAMFTAGSPPKQIAHDLETLLHGWKDSYQR